MESNINISNLMNRMIVQMSGEELCALTRYAVEGLAAPLAGNVIPAKTRQVVGVTPLSAELGCSASFLYALKAKGVLDGAIICQIGKKAVFDVDKARELANSYQKEQRASR